MSKDYWLSCDSCGCEWIGQPYRTDGTDERCPECDLDSFEVGDEYRSKVDTTNPFWILLLIPNFLLFLS